MDAETIVLAAIDGMTWPEMKIVLGFTTSICLTMLTLVAFGRCQKVPRECVALKTYVGLSSGCISYWFWEGLL